MYKLLTFVLSVASAYAQSVDASCENLLSFADKVFLQTYEIIVYNESSCSGPTAPINCNFLGINQNCRICWDTCMGATEYLADFPHYNSSYINLCKSLSNLTYTETCPENVSYTYSPTFAPTYAPTAAPNGVNIGADVGDFTFAPTPADTNAPVLLTPTPSAVLTSSATPSATDTTTPTPVATPVPTETTPSPTAKTSMPVIASASAQTLTPTFSPVSHMPSRMPIFAPVMPVAPSSTINCVSLLQPVDIAYLVQYNKSVYYEPLCTGAAVPINCNYAGISQNCRVCFNDCAGAARYMRKFPAYNKKDVDFCPEFSRKSYDETC